MIFKLQTEKEEEREPLMNGRVVVVEYLESSMSQELLCKFPDNSAFDFDYTQSSIWSPLVSRHFPPIVSVIANGVCGGSNGLEMVPMELGMSTQRKLSYEEEREGVLNNIGTDTFMRKVTTNLKKKITNSVSKNLHNLNNHCMKKMKRKKKKKAFDFSPNPPSAKGSSTTPTPKKGWAKVLKAASKHFKKKSKKKDSAANFITQPNYLRDENF